MSGQFRPFQTNLPVNVMSFLVSGGPERADPLSDFLEAVSQVGLPASAAFHKVFSSALGVADSSFPHVR